MRVRFPRLDLSMRRATPLIEPQQLFGELSNHIIVDCRADLRNPHIAEHEYAAGHIPGARHADLERDLSGPRSPVQGRHPLPSAEQLAVTLGNWGIGSGTSVVAYDDASGAFAARLWWLLKWLDHPKVRVLDGGYAAWLRAGLPVELEQPRPTPTAYVPTRVHYGWVASTAEIESRLGTELCLVDVRARARFAGAEEPIDPIAGHVPGARNYPFTESLSADLSFLPPAVLGERLAEMLRATTSSDAVAMCGSGVTACHLLLAMAVVGLPLGRLYAGSWSEWIATPGRKIVTEVLK
jgi:thiosulfate/3-mercaptopyruvate sulfurtransferase